jgi:Tfp pilus assembly protein PilF
MENAYLLEVHRTLGLCYLKKSDLELSKSAFLKALEFDENDIIAMNGLAQILAQYGDIDRAIDLCRKSLGVNQDQQDVNYNLALLLMQSGKSDESLVYLKRAAEMSKSNPPAEYSYANYLLRAGQLDLAQKYYTEFVGDKRITADAYNNLGLIEANQKHYQTAIKYFRIAVLLNPEHSKAMDNLRFAEELQTDISNN